MLHSKKLDGFQILAIDGAVGSTSVTARDFLENSTPMAPEMSLS